MIEYTGYALVIIGIIFNLAAPFSIIRFPDTYTRLISSSKCILIGAVAVLAGVFVVNAFCVNGVKAIICIVFLIVTLPVEAHALARAMHIKTMKNSDKNIGNDKSYK